MRLPDLHNPWIVSFGTGFVWTLVDEPLQELVDQWAPEAGDLIGSPWAPVAVFVLAFALALLWQRRRTPRDVDPVQRALAIAVTWLYRRANWDGLSDDGRYTEPAPEHIWAREKYDQLGLSGVRYDPPETVPPESGYSTTEGAHGVTRESVALHSLLGQGHAHLYNINQVAGDREAMAALARELLDSWETDVRSALRAIGVDASDFDAPMTAVEGMHHLDRPIETLRIKLGRLERMLV